MAQRGGGVQAGRRLHGYGRGHGRQGRAARARRATHLRAGQRHEVRCWELDVSQQPAVWPCAGAAASFLFLVGAADRPSKIRKA